MPLKSLTVAIAAALAIFGAGCRSVEFYQDRAVERARTFLFRNAPELDAEEVAFVRYTSPALLTAPILSGTDDFTEFQRELGNAKIRPAVLTQERSQICITWLIPGRDQAYIVCGSSSKDMMYWRPVKLIRRTLKAPDLSAGAARTRARDFLLRNQSGSLPDTDYDMIRFTLPEIRRTDFDWNSSLKQDESKFKDKIQFSMIWRSAVRPENCWIAVGAADDGDLTDWEPLWCAGIENSEADARTVSADRSRRLDQPEDKTDGAPGAGSLSAEERIDLEDE